MVLESWRAGELADGVGKDNIYLMSGEGNGTPLQYTCLENPMDGGAWWATVHGVATVGHDLVTKPSPQPNI